MAPLSAGRCGSRGRILSPSTFGNFCILCSVCGSRRSSDVKPFRAIERWLLDKNCMPPEQFVATMKNIVQRAAVEICRTMEETE